MTVPRYTVTCARQGTTGSNILDINLCAVLLKEVCVRALEPGEAQGLYQTAEKHAHIDEADSTGVQRAGKRSDGDGKEIRLQADAGMA